MRTVLIGVTLVMLVGCEGFEEAMNTERTGGPVAPGGIATTSDIEDVQQAASGQSVTPATQSSDKAAAEKAKQSADKPKPKPVPNKGILGRTTAKIVDVKKATQDPKIVPVENKIKGSDPLTVVGSAYVTISAKAGTLGMQQAIKHHKALNDKFPTYDEFMQIVKQNRVEFPEAVPYQLYGYDESSGAIIMLEDKAKKLQLFKKHGIPLEPGDEKYQ